MHSRQRPTTAAMSSPALEQDRYVAIVPQPIRKTLWPLPTFISATIPTKARKSGPRASERVPYQASPAFTSLITSRALSMWVGILNRRRPGAFVVRRSRDIPYDAPACLRAQTNRLSPSAESLFDSVSIELEGLQALVGFAIDENGGSGSNPHAKRYVHVGSKQVQTPSLIQAGAELGYFQALFSCQIHEPLSVQCAAPFCGQGLKQGFVIFQKPPLLGSAFGGKGSEYRSLPKPRELEEKVVYFSTGDVSLDYLAPWPEGVLAAVTSLIVEHVHDCHRCVGRSQSVPTDLGYRKGVSGATGGSGWGDRRESRCDH